MVTGVEVFVFQGRTRGPCPPHHMGGTRRDRGARLLKMWKSEHISDKNTGMPVQVDAKAAGGRTSMAVEYIERIKREQQNAEPAPGRGSSPAVGENPRVNGR